MLPIKVVKSDVFKYHISCQYQFYLKLKYIEIIEVFEIFGIISGTEWISKPSRISEFCVNKRPEK
jgi:hypothetical protein